MSARVLADPPRDPYDGWPTSPDKPHPGGPNGPRADLDRLSGPLLTGCTAWGRWAQAVADRPEPPATDRLVESREVARRVAAMGPGGDPR